MTTLGGYRAMESILDRLDRVRWRHLLVQLARSAAALATVVLAGLILLGVSAGYWADQPPATLRWGLLVGILTVWAAALAWLVLLPIRRNLNYHQTARLIERSFDGLDNSLINAIQLSRDRMQPSPALVQSAIYETSRRIGRLPLAAAVSVRSLRRWLIAAGVAAAGLAAFALLQGPRLSRGLAAVFRPTGYVRHVETVKLISLTPGDATRLAGERLTIEARIENPQRRRHEATVEILGRPERLEMLASPDRATYSFPYGKLEESFQYRVRIGQARFPAEKDHYTITVLQRLDVKGLDLLHVYPAYLNRQDHLEANARGPIEAPEGTKVKVTLHLSAPAPRARLEMRSGIKQPMSADGSSCAGTLDVSADDAYRIVLLDRQARNFQQVPAASLRADEAAAFPGGFFGIRAVPDRPPTVRYVRPNRHVAVAPGGKLPTRLAASDDHGIAKVRFFMGPAGEAPREVPNIADCDAARGKTSAEATYTINVGPQYRVGETIVYHATVTDNRLLPGRGPQTVKSSDFKIFIRASAEVAAERAERYERLRARLLAILKAQAVQRVNTDVAAAGPAELAKVRQVGRTVAAGQTAIRADVLDVAENFPFEDEWAEIRHGLKLLGENETAAAITQARSLAALADVEARPGVCGELAATQDEIIRSLQWMLAILPAKEHPEAVARTARGEDLPPEAREKLTDLQSVLKQFMDEQRKLIQTAERLTKRPVDNFTKEDEKLLRELQLAQDKWEKFLNEKFTDFSKLAQQDFSNPQLLKELISVKTDVTMAKDALSKKAIEIATAIEDNGIENAKTLTANIEKWLPDEPDRIKWDMEDPAGQSNIEMPELPKELEDLVGDLLEEEEDLFDEMDDVTAKYAMSGDKGIGWDAMDGPISNMNAQGVTGNQLPNTSEISGRSGEGRQGKSLGEFVEDKAVGKGGRRTPTRLTPEPFQQGQVNDTSAEPAGGATGGGKLSGAGAEGMEGPLPPELQKELKRLAGQHAQLLNKAERIRPAFKVGDYSNYQFLEAITLMNRVQDHLVHYRYRNVLRERHVTLTALKRTHLLLGGKIDVTADATAGPKKQLPDDVADTTRAKLPAEFRQALQKYFQRLSEAGR